MECQRSLERDSQTGFQDTQMMIYLTKIKNRD